MTGRFKVLAVVPNCDGTDVGEAWCAHQWVRHLGDVADVTLLTMRRKNRLPASAQLPHVEVIEWDEPQHASRFDRLNSQLKPFYVGFYVKVRRWLTQQLAAGRWFHVAHQFTPLALRYPSPLAGFPIPYVLGPLGGSLETPPGFASECESAAWFTRLRGLDQWRLKRDPLLKRTYAGAAAILGVAPYVEQLVAPAAPRRFDVISELGIDSLAPHRGRPEQPGKLRLLHVGRAVRTKGLRDAVRAISLLPPHVDVHLDVAGQGEETEICRALARTCGVESRVTFHGQIPRSDVEALYARADAFLFPSFREPSGSVIFEALRNGLPVITTDVGGPGFVIDDSCGFKVPAQTPEQLASDLAAPIRRLAADPALRLQLAAGARERVARIGLWPNKVAWLTELYAEIESSTQPQIEEVC